VLWERRDWSSSRLLHGRDLTLRLLGRPRRITLGTLASGLLLVAMGALTVVVAFTGPGMGNSGWREQMAADLQHWAALATGALSWLPGWAFALVLLMTLGLIARQVHRHHQSADALPPAPASPQHHQPAASAVAPDGRPDLLGEPVLESALGSEL
jgi:hypothetical protein